MAAPRPKKKAPVKKKPPAKKKPSFLRKDTSRPARDIKPGDLRSQTLANDNTPRPAKDLNKGGLRAKFLQDAGKSTSQSTTVKAPKTGILRGLGSKVFGAAGAIVDPTFLSGKGEGKLNNDPVTRSLEKSSTMSGMYKKMKREIRQGPKLAVTGVKEGITGLTPRLRKEQLGEIKYRTPIGPKRPSKKPAPGTNYSGQDKASAGSPFSKGKGNAALPKGKTGPSNTAATTAAKSSSGGTSKAAKSGVGRQTRYQRNETAMEQKRSSNRPKKSIFSLFRKG